MHRVYQGVVCFVDGARGEGGTGQSLIDVQNREANEIFDQMIFNFPKTKCFFKFLHIVRVLISCGQHQCKKKKMFRHEQHR